MAKVIVTITDTGQDTIDASMQSEPGTPVTPDEPGWPPTPAQRTGLAIMAALMDVEQQPGAAIIGVTVDREPSR
jgi:hypothetical protein